MHFYGGLVRSPLETFWASAFNLEHEYFLPCHIHNNFTIQTISYTDPWNKKIKTDSELQHIKAQDLCIISCFAVHSGDQCKSMGAQQTGIPAYNDASPYSRYWRQSQVPAYCSTPQGNQ